MNREILMVVDAVANEKGVPKEVIFDAMEAALASAAKKRTMEEIECRVSIDRGTGDYETFRRWEIIPNEEDRVPENDEEEIAERKDWQIYHEEAIKDRPEIQIGDFIEEPMENPEFGRIAAQAAKQVIVQRVREAERAQVVEAYKDRVGELVSGIVKRVERGNVHLDLGSNAEAMIPRDKMIMRESVRPGDRLRGYLVEVTSEARGPQLFVSRASPEFLIELFRLEVPEIGQDLIDVMGAARDPGMRAKIAVKSNDPRTDPIGACVGMRGSRVQAVSNELAGERIDIILYDPTPAQFVINAMAPAEVVSIIVDEDRGVMDIAVTEDKLSQAIGRGGQNVRLASELTGWQLNVMSEEEVEAKSEAESIEHRKGFQEKLDVDEEIAVILVQEGFTTVEEIAYVPESELLAIEEFDADVVEELRSRARDALLTQMIAREEKLGDARPAEDLLALEGMTEDLAFELASKKILTQEDLAELAVDELTEFSDVDDERASSLIMAARAPWFADEESAGDASDTETAA